jgi:hypothetical protein
LAASQVQASVRIIKIRIREKSSFSAVVKIPAPHPFAAVPFPVAAVALPGAVVVLPVRRVDVGNKVLPWIPTSGFEHTTVIRNFRPKRQ